VRGQIPAESGCNPSDGRAAMAPGTAVPLAFGLLDFAPRSVPEGQVRRRRARKPCLDEI